ncbi:MAG: hypothetical protein GF365_02605 [Candidatus Buchananbacteria bacterium]|nr:hypothetical protein [Candidatus Buchananbacteria bacterium]
MTLNPLEKFICSDNCENLNYSEIAKEIWEKKGLVDYDRSELLIVSRLTGSFNVGAFAEELKIYKWTFSRIWFTVFNSEEQSWTIFEVVSTSDRELNLKPFQVKLNDLPY